VQTDEQNYYSRLVKPFLPAFFTVIITTSLRFADREAAEALFLPIEKGFTGSNGVGSLHLLTLDTERRAIARAQRVAFVSALCCSISITRLA
jgi:hypothetical protein